MPKLAYKQVSAAPSTPSLHKAPKAAGTPKPGTPKAGTPGDNAGITPKNKREIRVFAPTKQGAASLGRTLALS